MIFALLSVLLWEHVDSIHYTQPPHVSCAPICCESEQLDVLPEYFEHLEPCCNLGFRVNHRFNSELQSMQSFPISSYIITSYRPSGTTAGRKQQTLGHGGGNNSFKHVKINIDLRLPESNWQIQMFYNCLSSTWAAKDLLGFFFSPPDIVFFLLTIEHVNSFDPSGR